MSSVSSLDSGKDKNCTKTGEDRIVTLWPRAIRVVARQGQGHFVDSVSLTFVTCDNETENL